MSMVESKLTAAALLFVGLLALAANPSRVPAQAQSSPPRPPAAAEEAGTRRPCPAASPSASSPTATIRPSTTMTRTMSSPASTSTWPAPSAWSWPPPATSRCAPWPELLPALRRGEADAVIASHAISANALKAIDFTDRYYHTPARFAGKRTSGRLDVTPEGLEGKKIAVTKGTAHEAYLRTFFRDSSIRTFDTPELARDALISGAVDLLFDDGISLAFWLNGTGLQGLLRVQGRPVRRAQVLRRRRGHRREPRGPAAQGAHQRGAQAHARERPLRGAGAALLPAARVLTVLRPLTHAPER